MADALADCTGSIGFTRRAGGGRTPSLNLSHAAAVVLSQLFDLKQQQLMAADAVAAAAAAAGGAAAGEAGGPAPAPPPSVDPARAATGLMSGSLFESERVRWQREQALTAAPQAEVEALLARAAALLEAAGFSSKESSGGGNRSNHGRKRQLMGHVRALLLRGQASTAEIRALHGLCKELEGRQRAIGGGGAS
ncbi:rRNA methyltransferase [Micractinium conductrix]|uniref:rRNA methyltransferase n=1 Tax=Micractinium conductrix TaxID=554055 RepID=A0A2P6VNU7_9CHLO|nr:rRNA methyltransferase [Micractinium conductrix]|eukprot:PSC75750.1 rRNA methyltransferase [Micractinium conductrix]